MSHITSLVSFFVHRSTHPWRDRGILMAIVLLGILGGAASVGLLALMSRELSGRGVPAHAALVFAGLALVLAGARFGSQSMLASLVQRQTARLRVELTRQILATTLREIETIGPARLLAALTDDVATIMMALNAAPALILNVSLIVCCIGYFVTLSWQLSLFAIPVLGLATATYRLPVTAARRHYMASRANWDELIGHFHALTGGVKELQIHQQRRDEFVADLLIPTTERVRHHWTRGSVIHAATSAWEQILFFGLVALVLFGVPAWFSVDRYVITGFALVLVYMIGPLEALFTQVPNLERAGVAARNLERLGLSLAHTAADSPQAVVPLRDWGGIPVRSIEPDPGARRGDTRHGHQWKRQDHAAQAADRALHAAAWRDPR
jgi:putative ATP-binding cassette transporter